MTTAVVPCLVPEGIVLICVRLMVPVFTGSGPKVVLAVPVRRWVSVCSSEDRGRRTVKLLNISIVLVVLVRAPVTV